MRGAISGGYALAAVALFAIGGIAPAQAAEAAGAVAPRHWSGPQGDSWQSIAKLPDWQGAWNLDMDTFQRGRQTAVNPKQNPYSAPLSGKWEAYRLSNGAANNGDGPATGTVNNATRCLPDGMPALMSAPHAFLFLFTPGMVVILSESGEYRLIHTDGRSHPDDVADSWDGDSIGHWEGDTLVIDTIGINPRSELFMGMPDSSEKTHVIERMRLNPEDHKIHLDVTVTDPGVLTRPFKYTNTFTHAPMGLTESYCQENNRDTDRGVTNLTPPAN